MTHHDRTNIRARSENHWLFGLSLSLHGRSVAKIWKKAMFSLRLSANLLSYAVAIFGSRTLTMNGRPLARESCLSEV